MSKYYTVHRESRTYSGTEEFKHLFGALYYIWRWIKEADSRRPSEYTFTVKERNGWELVEKRELKRLKQKYEEQTND